MSHPGEFGGEGVLSTAVLARLGPDEASDAAREFVRQAADDCETGELPEVSPADLAVWLADFWRFGDRLADEEPRIDLVRAVSADGQPVKRDLLRIIQPDAPFLVDSVMGELADEGYSVRAMFHPLLDVARDDEGRRTKDGRPRAESMILVVLDPVGEDRVAPLIQAVRSTLADVHAAVDDFDAMTALMQRTIAELEAGGVRGDPEAFAEELAFLRWLSADRFVFLGARVYQYPRTADGGYARRSRCSSRRPAWASCATLRARCSGAATNPRC
jgi:glutamate dehydrogenase